MARPPLSRTDLVKRLNDGSIPDPLGLGRPDLAIPGRRIPWDVGRRRVMATGYMMVKLADGLGGSTIRVYEHRRVMEELVLSRPLRKGESARHRNGDTLDNRPENLILYVGEMPADVQPAVVVEGATNGSAPKRKRRPPRSRPYALIPVPVRPIVKRAASDREAEDLIGDGFVAVPVSRLRRP